MRGHLFRPRGPSRRAFLLGGAAAVTAGAAGGIGAAVLRPAARPAPLPAPPAALVAAIQAERALVTGLGAATIDPALAARLRADHVAHEQALQELADELYGVTVPEKAGGSTGSAPGPLPPPRLDASRAGAAERDAAGAAERRAERLDGRTAALLASIAACEAGHAVQLLGRGALPPGGLPATPGARSLEDRLAAAWQAALAAEQRAVFGYALLGPQLRTDAGQLALAVHCSDAHERLRDDTEQLLTAAGRTPAAPEADYPQLYPVRDAAAAGALALRLENDCAAAWRYLYAQAARNGGATGASSRAAAQRALTSSAVRAVRWLGLVHPGAPSAPFPGL